MKKAFTLIELLIVIAIIAILALIAVPNFLEAQVRAKVSRVHADMRTAATAIEAYSVDWGTPPPGVQERQNNLGDPRNGPTLRVVVWMPLTTPVAFMSSMIYDPFLQREDDDSRQNYTYNTFVVLDNGSTGARRPMKEVTPVASHGGSVASARRGTPSQVEMACPTSSRRQTPREGPAASSTTRRMEP